jgi:predicted dehydrogenase
MVKSDVLQALDQARRQFLKTSGAAALSAASVSLGAEESPRNPKAPSSDKLVMAAIGCGGQGTNLITSFARQPDVEVACVCDPDSARADAAARKVEEITGQRPEAVADLRRVLDCPRVHAITIATPDHWHGPATILACQAGKHVYVEKPCSHNIREGRLMLEAARRHNRVVQVGTQSRSAPHVQRAMELLRDGAIGRVLVAKAWNSQLRRDIGHGLPSEAPGGVDYDLWLGPVPYVPFQANRFHYGWHWWYDFGTGDMGNDGVHDIDIARWGLGVDAHPAKVAAIGGKRHFDDDQQFPDTQYVAFEYPGDGSVGSGRELIFEMRIWSPYKQEGHENGNAFYGTEGMLVLGKGTGWQLFGPRNEPRESMKASGMGEPHHRNFIDCIRSGARPNADIEIGHLSATLCHLGNIACRVGRQLTFDPQAERIVGDDEADRLTARTYRDGHWAAPREV